MEKKKKVNKTDKRFKLLEKELKPYMEVLTNAMDTILDQEVSDFPIMVIHKGEVEVGIPLVDRNKVAGNWSVNASTLEEFTVKNLITTEKIDSFKSLYESHSDQICLFLLSEFGANFVFIKRS